MHKNANIDHLRRKFSRSSSIYLHIVCIRDIGPTPIGGATVTAFLNISAQCLSIHHACNPVIRQSIITIFPLQTTKLSLKTELLQKVLSLAEPCSINNQQKISLQLAFLHYVFPLPLQLYDVRLFFWHMHALHCTALHFTALHCTALHVVFSYIHVITRVIIMAHYKFLKYSL